MIFTYRVQVGAGPARRGEIEAEDAVAAATLAALREAGDAAVIITHVFSPPPRQGERVRKIAERRRLNFRAVPQG